MISRIRLVERVKYTLRYKYRKGHRIHSPYVYNMVRSLFMKRRSFTLPSDAELTVALCQLGLKYDYAYRVGQFLKYNNLERFSVNPICYDGEDLVVFSHIDDNTISIIDRMRLSDSRKAVVVLNIYRHRECREWWREQNELSLDLYRMGIIIFDSDLNKEYFKLKI